MPISGGGGGSGGGSGTVTSVASADTSIVVTNPTTTPSLQVGTMDVLFTNEKPAASVPMNTHKFTGMANGAAATDSAAFGQIPTALPPNGSAGGDLGSTYPNPTVTSGAHLTAASVPIASLADPTTGMLIGSVANAAAAVIPPGFEIGYDQITSAVNIVGTTAAGATTIITCAAHTFDGAPVIVTFFTPQLAYPTAALLNTIGIDLWEGATNLGELSFTRTDQTTNQDYKTILAQWRFTPTAASHTYLLKAYASSTTGTPSVGAGAGGVTTDVPAFVRFTKV